MGAIYCAPERACGAPPSFDARQEGLVAAWTEEIVWIKTDDGIEHDGVVMRPTGSPTGTAVVWMHGFTGHFSEPHQIRS